MKFCCVFFVVVSSCLYLFVPSFCLFLFFLCSQLRAREETRVMIFTHGGVLKLERYGGTRFLHGECR